MKKKPKHVERKIGGVSVEFSGGRGHWGDIARISNADEYPDVVAGEDLVPEKAYYILFCVWSTGDSFGSEDMAYCEAFAIYPTFEAGERAAKAIREHERAYKNREFKNFDDGYYLYIPSWDGNGTQRITAPWNGYFESLDYVKVQSVRLNDGCVSF